MTELPKSPMSNKALNQLAASRPLVSADVRRQRIKGKPTPTS